MEVKRNYDFLQIALCSTLLLSHTITYAPFIENNTQPYSLLRNETLKYITTPKKDYTLELKTKNAWVSGPIQVIALKHNKKTIALFQSPLSLTEEQLPRFSNDGHYLLILNAEWTLFYQVIPQKFEWNLFDLKRKKVIKRFPYDTNPIFAFQNGLDLTIFSHDNKLLFSQERVLVARPPLIQGLRNLLSKK